MSDVLDALAVTRAQGTPTIDNWLLEFRRVLGGKRGVHWEQSSPAEYLLSLQESSKDRDLGEHYFKEAVRMLVAEWKPQAPQDYRSVLVHLDLIQAVKPTGGFAPAHDFLRFHWDDLEQRFQPLAFGPVVNLRHKGMMACSEYFRSAPEDAATNPAYKNYVDLLGQALRDHPDALGAWAASRLALLKALDSHLPAIREFVGKDPVARVVAIVDLMASSATRDELAAFRRRLFPHSKKILPEVQDRLLDTPEAMIMDELSREAAQIETVRAAYGASPEPGSLPYYGEGRIYMAPLRQNQ